MMISPIFFFPENRMKCQEKRNNLPPAHLVYRAKEAPKGLPPDLPEIFRQKGQSKQCRNVPFDLSLHYLSLIQQLFDRLTSNHINPCPAE